MHQELFQFLKLGFEPSLFDLQEKMKIAEDIVKDHLLYLDAVHEFSDWLHSAKEELHRWLDTSGDLSAIQKKLAKINVRNCFVVLLLTFVHVC